MHGISSPHRGEGVRPGPRLGLAGLALALAATGAASAGCGSDNASASGGGQDTKAVTLRLGYFPNVTHATAIVGVQKGIFAKALGDKVTLDSAKTFNAGPAAIEALFSGAIDATYIGPGPSVNAYVKSKGKALRIISGATSGGAALVVKPNISTPSDLRGKKIASPQLGNTQDVALRYYLSTKGLKTDPQGGGDVHITPQENSQTLDTFAAGTIDGAWVPEPYATRLVKEGGKVLVDERSLWPGGRFVTTNLIVRTEFLKEHPDAVKRLLEGQVEATDFVNANPTESQTIVGDAIKKITGKALKPDVLAAAWKNLSFTDDPLATTLKTAADHAVAVGLLKKADLRGIYDLGLLNSALKAAGKPEVSAS